MNVVPLVGVYSTEAHPFGLIYEYMEGLDLKQHLRNQPSVGTLELVTTSRAPSPSNRISDASMTAGWGGSVLEAHA